MFGEQADQMPMSVDHDQVANAVFEHALGSLGQRPVGGDTDGRAGHDRRQSGIALALQEEANDIVLGDDAQRSAAIDNDDATAAHGGHASQCIIEAGIGRQARKGPFHQRIDCIQMHEEVGAEKFAEVGFVDDAERQAGFVGHHDAADAEAGGCAVSLAGVGVGRDAVYRVAHRLAGRPFGRTLLAHDAQDVALGNDAHGNAAINHDDGRKARRQHLRSNFAQTGLW